MWEFEVLMRDSGMSGVLRDIQAKSGMVGNYDMYVAVCGCVHVCMHECM